MNRSATVQANPGSTSSPDSSPAAPTSAHVPSSRRITTVFDFGLTTQINFTPADRY